MTKWVPAADFDEQQLEIQPDCDTTFAYYGRNITSLPTSNPDENDDFEEPPNEAMLKNHELNIVQKIKSTIYGDTLIGRRLNADEIVDPATCEIEIIAMIRQAGMGRSVDEGLSSKCTIPAIDSDEPHTRRNFPVLYDENYFKLRPRKKSSKSGRESNSSTDSSLSKNDADLTNGHVPKISESSTEQQKTNKQHRHRVSSPTDVTSSSENLKERIFSPSSKNKPSSRTPSKSPLPVPRDNAHTPVLQISKERIVTPSKNGPTNQRATKSSLPVPRNNSHSQISQISNDNIISSSEKDCTSQSTRKSPLPLSHNNANTPISETSKATNVKIRKKPKIAANFAALDKFSDCTPPLTVDPDRILKLRNSMKFVTPAELYRKTCQLKEKNILGK